MIPAPITANAATAKVVGVGKTFTVKKATKVSGLSKAEKKIVKVTVNKKKRTVTVKGVKAGKASFKIGKKAYTVKVGATSITKKSVTTSMTAGQKKTLSVNAVNGKGDTITFTSNKKGVVKVNKASAKANAKKVASTTVTAVAEGTAKITAKSKYTGKSKTFTIKVVAATPAPTQAPSVATTPAITTPSATPGVATTPAVKVTATPGTDASATPGTDATATPGADVTATPGADVTQAPGTEATATPGADATQAPDAPVAETGTITVTTNVTEAAIKVISGTAVVKEVTTDGTTTSATFADLANGTYTIEVTKPGYGVFTTTQVVAGSTYTIDASLELATVKSVKATSETRIQVEFNAPVDKAEVSNFKIDGLTVTKATLSENQMYVILETSTMTKGTKYTLTTTGLTTNEIAMASTEDTFEGKEIKYEMKLSFADNKTALVSNGQDAVLVTATLYDEDGEIVKDLDKVEIKFDTTAGAFGETKVTAQNGKASNMLTSETSTTDISALVTATVVSATNKNLLNVTASTTVLMQPKVDTEADETMGATLTSIAVETCDRIVLYFNKDVNIEDYTVQDESVENVYGIDKEKLKILVQDNATNEQTTVNGAGNRTVVALKEVKDNSKALEAILDVDSSAGEYLTDNSRLLVQVTDLTKTVKADATKDTLVSEIRVPSILGVENDGLRSIKVIFSEPVQNNTVGSYAYNAQTLSHWRIDGTQLDSERWGANTGSGEQAKVTVGDYDILSGEDTRNVVTITLGKTKTGKKIYFSSGAHSIQGDKIGDWANMTDVNNNIVNTQTLDFTIAPDDSVPTAEVTVDSPEQYTVTFNKAVDIDEVTDNIELEVYNETTDTWSKLHDVADAGIVVEAVKKKATDDTAKEFVVTVTKDWTEELDTATTHKNYYNNSYRLHIAAEKVTNPSNGKTNLEQKLLLNDQIMKEPDIVSPEIVDAHQNGTTNNFTITMSEPVQVPNLPTETTTASQTQSQSGSGVPMVDVKFIKLDNSVTVPAEITKMSDAHDKEFVVSPIEELSAGTYRVVVSSISDDVGNTSKTLADKTLEVKAVTATVDNSFKALWAVAVPARHKEPITGQDHIWTDDVVYIKFNKQFKTTGAAANAVSTANYTVGGISVPTDSKIDVSLVDYNDNANIKNGYTDLVAIHLKNGTLNKLSHESNSVTISSTIEALTGGTLSNGGMKIMNYVDLGSSTPIGSPEDIEDYYAWNFGTYTQDVSGLTQDVVMKVSEVQSVLNSGANNVVNFYSTLAVSSKVLKITSSASADIKITHAGTYDFTGQTFKSLTVDTNETGKIEIIGGTYGEINVTAPNADVDLTGTAAVTSVTDSDLSTPKTYTTTGNVNVKDIMNGTLTMGSTASVAGDVVITDANGGCAVDIDPAATITGNIVVNTNGEVTLNADGISKKRDVVVKKDADLVFLSLPDSIVLESGAKGVTISGYTTPINDSLYALISLADGVDASVKPSASDIVSAGEELAMTRPLTLDGWEFFADENEDTELTGNLTLTEAATTVYAINTTADSNGDKLIVKLNLSTQNSTSVTAKIVKVTNNDDTDYDELGTAASITNDGTVTLTPGKSLTLTGALNASGYKFYSDSACKKELTSKITVGAEATTIYAKSSDGVVSFKVRSTDGATVTVAEPTVESPSADNNTARVSVTAAGDVTITLS